MTRVPSIGKEGEKGGVPCAGKSTPTAEEAEESRRGRSSAPYEGKDAAREIEKKFMGDVEEEG